MRVIKREDFDPKGSPRLISIHPEVWQDMKQAQLSLDTIIPGTQPERLQACKKNVAWLRALGWNARLPNHALRPLRQHLRLATPQEIQARNSLVQGKKKPRLLNFERLHASL